MYENFETSSYWTGMIISLLLTMLIYGLGPILFLALRKKPVEARKVRWFSGLYTVMVALFCAFVEVIYFNITPKFTAAIIWGIVFYKFMTSQLLSKGLLLERAEKSKIQDKSKTKDLEENGDGKEAPKKYFIVDSETGEVVSETTFRAINNLSEKKTENRFKQFLALLILFISFLIVSIMASLVFRFLLWAISEMSKMSASFHLVFLLFVGGSTFIGIALAPLFYGIPLAIGISESIAVSPHGLRYIVFSATTIVFCGLVIAVNLVYRNTWAFVYIYMIIFSIIVGIFGVNVNKSKNNEN